MAGDAAYREAEGLGRALAEAGFTVATGGYIGTMEAVSKGAAEAGGLVIGVTCDQIEHWRAVVPNPWVKVEVRLPTLHERAFRLIEMASVLLGLPGGLGTLSEIALAWSVIQVGQVSPRPLVLIGREWRTVFDTFFGEARDYLKDKDLDCLHFVPHVDGALALLREPGILGAREESIHEQG
jgi:uncharacterized protein (TIGR00730 family)